MNTNSQTTNSQTDTKDTPIPILPRHPHFDTTEDLATIWNKDKNEKLALFKTAIMDSLSILFPEGERFFIRSVKNFEDQVSDPKLLEEVKLFIEQEGQHTREHYKYNQALKQRGYDVDKMEQRLKNHIKLMRKFMGSERHLGATCATEHFTAVLGDYLLNSPQLIEGASPKMQALWKWHAVEEIEHKAVAFDVYKTAVNSEYKRKATFFSAISIVVLNTFLNMCHMFRKEGKLFDLKLWLSGAGFLFNRKDGILRIITPKLLEYLKRDFHPWDENNSHLVDNWRKANEDSEGIYTPSFS